jgi:hypothetical protein
MRDLKDLGILLLGFVPWLLFLFLAGHSLASLERAIVLGLVASLTFGFGELRRGYLLQWGTLLFFSASALVINVLSITWIATQMDLLANTALACVMWLTIGVGKPFALQYARRDLPPERWHEPNVVRGCRLITLVWASLMTIAAAISVARRTVFVHLPDWVYFDASLVIITTGVVFTVLYKRHKRLRHAAARTQ